MSLSNAFVVRCKIYLCTAENWQTFMAHNMSRDHARQGDRRS